VRQVLFERFLSMMAIKISRKPSNAPRKNGVVFHFVRGERQTQALPGQHPEGEREKQKKPVARAAPKRRKNRPATV
jgi:hypothetical protein